MAGPEVGRIPGATDSNLILRMQVLLTEVAMEAESATARASEEEEDWVVVVMRIAGKTEAALAIRALTTKILELVALVGVAGKPGTRSLRAQTFGRGRAEAEEQPGAKPCSTPTAFHRTGTIPRVHGKPLWRMERGTVGGSEVQGAMRG